MTDYAIDPFFLEGVAGQIFVLARKPVGANRCILIVPPFGEEMNKCRRQLTETAHSLIDEGFAVVLPDLYGTGDSEGEFCNARWDTWQSDVAVVIEWIQQSELSLYAVIAVRLGCALAACALRSDNGVSRTVFWQPVESGRQYMNQFLRLRAAASMMGPDKQETVESLRKTLIEGGVLEVAGYSLSSELFREVEALRLSELLSPSLGEVVILEVGRSDDSTLSPAGRALLDSALKRGLEVTGERVRGEPFWTSTEIVLNSDLVDRTANCLTRRAAHESRAARSS